MRHVILGTSGHIDHGKSALVKALTGIDPDRLKEEKERGITIDIGFADLAYPGDDLVVGIIDVPGHERLISNMLAGAGGIDMVMLVIAADEGIMPQSREHLAICNLLAISSGLLVITKTDLVEKEWLQLVQDEVRTFVRGTFLENAPMIPVSSRTGENIALLREEIRRVALTLRPKKTGGLFRLPIDRVFTLKGFGTVVTGTAVSGTLSSEDALEIMPGHIATRVRGLQSHGSAIRTACAGQRVAINLQGIEKEAIARGDVAVTPGSFFPTTRLDAEFSLLPEAPALKSRSLVHFYTGTAETIARIIVYEKEELKPGETGYCQFRLQAPVIAMSGDRYIVRRFSPLETLGGGEILDPAPSRRKRTEGVDDLKRLHGGSLEEKLVLKIERSGVRGISTSALNGWIQADQAEIAAALGAAGERKEVHLFENLFLHRKAVEQVHQRIVAQLDRFHRSNPLKPGMQKEELRTLLNVDGRLFHHLLAMFPDITVERDMVRKKDFTVALSGAEADARGRIMKLLKEGGFQPPTRQEITAALKLGQKEASDMLGMLVRERAVVKISETMYLHGEEYARLLALLKEFFSKKAEISVPEFKDLIGVSRKYALPLLEHLDAARVTIRIGDIRKIMLKS